MFTMTQARACPRSKGLEVVKIASPACSWLGQTLGRRLSSAALPDREARKFAGQYNPDEFTCL